MRRVADRIAWTASGSSSRTRASFANISSICPFRYSLTTADAESLMFGLSKAYRTARGENNVFVGNEINYRRFRSIPPATGGNERVFGMAHGSYEVLDHPYKVAPTAPNTKVAFANLGYYRMLRRLGLQVKVDSAGKENTLKNQQLIVVRMRYGGQMEFGGAVAIMADVPA